MSYNGSGTFNINSAGQPVVTGTVISTTAFNALTADLGTGLSTAITKDGQTTTTARIPFAAGINSSLVTDATNTTTGSIITAGGVGIAKALFVGTTLNVAGASTLAAITGTFNGTVGATTPAAGAFTTVTATTTASSAAVTINGTHATGGTFFLVQRSGVAKSYFGSSISISGVGTANDTDIYAVGDGRLFGGDQTTNFTRFTSTGLAVTGTLSATGLATVGAGGTGSVTADLNINGSNASGYGSTLTFKQNSVANGQLGQIGAILGTSSQEMGYLSRTGHQWLINYSATIGMTLASTGIITMPAYGAGTATFSAAGVISSVSDETWKVKDGAPVDTDVMIKKLEPGYWYYNDEKKEAFGKDRQLGFYAQNVNAAIGPEAAPEPETFTTKNEDGTETITTKPWGYYDRSVLAVTVMSLQKALATIESLTARITALEAK